ncbi:MAG: hypothetical protein KDB26_08155 [Microthrixaceae bacterium]|nr:hypothetical protein [Microthrixaceae bacterium]
MLHINHNMIERRNRAGVPDYTRFAVRTLYRGARAGSVFELTQLPDALSCLVAHTPYVTASEVDNVNDALEALADAIEDRFGNRGGTALRVTDAAAVPLLSDHRFDPTQWTSEGADAHLVDGGYVLPEAPLGWSWATCSGCAVPVPVQDAPSAFDLCDECLSERWNAA